METGPLQVPLCGVCAESPRTLPLGEQGPPGRCHRQAVRQSLQLVLWYAGLSGAIACAAYTLSAFLCAPARAPPMVLSTLPALPPVAMNRSSPVVDERLAATESTTWWRWLPDTCHQLFVEGRQLYFAFWHQEAREICNRHHISPGCCDEISTGIRDVRWTIYHIAILFFALGAFGLWSVYKVGYYAKPKAPGYWKNAPWNPFFDSFFEQVDVTEEWKDAIQQLFDLTTDPRRMGKGMDGSFVKHKGFTVTKVMRIENGHLWTTYMNAVSSTVRRTPQHRMSKMPKDLVQKSKRALQIIDKHNEKIRATESVRNFIDSLNLKSRTNETILFHACPDRGARHPETGEFRFGDMSPMDVVKKAGLDDRVGSASGMLGSGTYFADMASKADQYAGKYGAPEDTTVGETASMFLARVALGCPYLTETSLEQMRRPPCTKGHFDPNLVWSTVQYGKPWHEKKLPMEMCDHSRFDSVMSDRQIDEKGKLYHEYAVYGKQCYPEFCVTYERTA